MYLAAIADAQPQGPMMTSQVHYKLKWFAFGLKMLWNSCLSVCWHAQMAPHPVMQQGGFYMQHPQAAAVPQQPVFTPKGPLQFNNPHPMQELQQQQQQQMHQHHPQGLSGQRGMRPVGANNSMNPIHAEASRGGGSSTAPPETKAPSDVRGGNKQDAPEAGASGADGPGSSATGKGSGDAEAK